MICWWKCEIFLFEVLIIFFFLFFRVDKNHKRSTNSSLQSICSCVIIQYCKNINFEGVKCIRRFNVRKRFMKRKRIWELQTDICASINIRLFERKCRRNYVYHKIFGDFLSSFFDHCIFAPVDRQYIYCQTSFDNLSISSDYEEENEQHKNMCEYKHTHVIKGILEI